MSKFLVTDSFGSPLGTALLEAAGVKPEVVSRLVLDLRVGSLGRLYLETFADDAVLQVNVAEYGVQITEDKE